MVKNITIIKIKSDKITHTSPKKNITKIKYKESLITVTGGKVYEKPVSLYYKMFYAIDYFFFGSVRPNRQTGCITIKYKFTRTS